jgi:hypothetical protein
MNFTEGSTSLVDSGVRYAPTNAIALPDSRLVGVAGVPDSTCGRPARRVCVTADAPDTESDS